MVGTVRIRPACGLACGDQARLVWAVRDGSAVLLLGLLLAGAVACTCPVLLAAAVPRTVAVVSGLAQRPRSGLALTRRTRLRSSDARGRAGPFVCGRRPGTFTRRGVLGSQAAVAPGGGGP